MRMVYSAFQKLTEFRYQNRADMGQVFMFHQIINSYTNSLNGNMCLEKEEFYKFINLLLSNGTIKDISELNGEGQKGDFYLTFDDIYSNAYENAIDWLTDIQVPFTVFITLNYLDKDNYISTDQLRELTRNKYCTIGSHTITHPILRFKNHDEVIYEMIDSKERLEFIIGKDVEYFAYPYGSKYACSRQVIEAAEEAGYKNAFSTYSMGINSTYFCNNPYFIPRINVNNYLIKKLEACYESDC